MNILPITSIDPHEAATTALKQGFGEAICLARQKIEERIHPTIKARCWKKVCEGFLEPLQDFYEHTQIETSPHEANERLTQTVANMIPQITNTICNEIESLSKL